MKLSAIPTDVLVSELERRGFVDGLHIVRFSAAEIELVHSLACRARPDYGIVTCEYGLVMMQQIEEKRPFPINQMGSYYVDLVSGQLVNWRLT